MKLGRYVVFAGADGCITHGWYDVHEYFDSEAEAIAEAEALHKPDEGRWAHAVDLDARQLISDGSP